MWRQSMVALAGILSTLVLPWSALANVASQLDYFREGSASHCPNEAKLREAVNARLGYDPFIEWSPRRVVVEIVADGVQLTAILRLVEGGGIVQSRSELSTDKNDCVELIAAVALAIAIHLDPDTVTRVSRAEYAQSVETESEVPGKTEQSVVPPTTNHPRPLSPKHGSAAHPIDATVSAPKPSTPLFPAIRLGAAFLQGLEPHATLALKAGASLRYGHFHAITEMLAGLPESQHYAGGGIRSHLVSATFLPCTHYRWLSGCAEAMADVVWSQGFDVSKPIKANLFHVAVGARAEANWELSRAWAAIVGFDLLRNLTSTSLRLQQTEVWKSPSYRYGFGLAVEVRFP